MTRPLAISMGEPAGVGPDLILQLYSERRQHELPAFVVWGNLAFLQARAERLEVDVTLASVGVEAAAEMFDTALPVFDIAGDVPDTPGKPHAAAGAVVVEAIRAATAAVLEGDARGLVTAPINKGVLYGAGFSYPGHTEFLGALCASGGREPLSVMMLAHGGLRAVPVTIHVPIHAVSALLTQELIVRTGRIVARDLRTRFRVAQPRLAMAGLNPHAGEGGAIGREEVDVVEPAVAQLRAEGIDVAGPMPADTLFYPAHWERYDAVLAMYHDQALIPIKTVAFEDAVNVTLGLPIVRTSPDHGTAFALAGTGRASSRSFLQAIRLAHEMTA